MARIILWILILVFLLPTIAQADEGGILPAICRNVLAAETGETPIPIKDILISETKKIPGKILSSVSGKIDGSATNLARSLESLKVPEVRNANSKSETLGASTQAEEGLGILARIRNWAVDGLQFLAREWQWT